MKLIVQLTGLMICIWLFPSCLAKKPIQYLETSFDTTRYAQVKIPEPLIQQGDLLVITVFSDNPTASALYNQGNSLALPQDGVKNGAASALPDGGAAKGDGYLVDQEGYIRMPGVGKQKAEGLTKKQLSVLLTNEFNKKGLLVNPAFDIRFNNFKVTLIGEVTRPGVYSIPAERVTILEALGLAGDLSNWAIKDNVTIIREINGKREFGRLNLTDAAIFESPYYFLQQNDVVIVAQNKRKLQGTDQVTIRNVSIFTSIITAAAVVITLFRN
ncbi:MAG: polysaccharide biosynthesis/export family protein [Pseudobacter sp.]|uniref:polysaccharide biosynthesis/export family protein n=1 Tax=Pseudobacter sp. TaxID=2045420 RepID=UPI003F7DE2E9